MARGRPRNLGGKMLSGDLASKVRSALPDRPLTDSPLGLTVVGSGRPSSLANVASSAGHFTVRVESELEKLGVDVKRTNGGLPHLASRTLTALNAKQMRLSRSAGYLRRWRSRIGSDSGRVILQMSSSEVEPPATGLIATLDDMTVIQALELGAFGYGDLPERLARQAIGRQRRWYERSIVCFSHSTWHAQSIERDFGIDSDRIVVLGGAFDLPVESHEPAERSWERPKFLFGGLDWDRKNGDRVVEAFRTVRGVHPRAELHLMGRHPQVNDPGVVNHHFLNTDDPGHRRIRQSLFESCTCLVVPSLVEPSGSIHAEAAASGMAVIGTRIGGNSETIGSAGVTVNPHEQSAITEAMLKLADPSTARAMAAQGPDHVTGQTFENVARRIRDELVSRLTTCVP